MSKLPRIFQKLFGSTGTTTDFGQFGSLAAGAATTTKDPDDIQALTEFLKGWADAVIATNRPALEDMNSLFLLAFRQIAYGFQEGIPEYDSSTEYHQNSVVKKTGTYELYGSIINTNTGNALPSQVDDANWEYLGSLATIQATRYMIGQEVAVDYEPSAGDMTTNRILFSDGSAVSRTTYSELFAKVGVIHGQGDGATTFNLPDKRGRFSRGWDNGAGVDPDAGSRVADATGGVTGDNVGSVQDDEIESHTHTVNPPTSQGATSGGKTVSGNEANETISQYNTGSTGGNETRPKNKYVWIGIAY